MSLKINDRQREAIVRIDENIVVNAGAGTGKTTVLVQRYLEILERGNLRQTEEVESIVAITFTKKAAEEMQERIRTEISKRAKDNDLWKKYYRDLERANISTIHSFCGNILRENAIELGLDPRFQILDESLSQKLLDTSIESVVEDELRTNDLLLEFLMELKILRMDKLVLELKNLYFKLRNNGLKLEKIKTNMKNKLESLNLDYELVRSIGFNLEILLENSRANSKIYKFSKTEAYEKIKNLNFNSNEDLIESMEELSSSLGTNKNFQDKIDEMQLLINKVLSLKEAFNSQYYPMILDLLGKIDGKYKKEKDKRAGLDYEDLQIYLNNLLEFEDYRLYYQDRYRYLMIDEFQDTNELQKEIFYKLASRKKSLDRKNLFIVGDPKQSIYGFRGGDLSVFHRVIEDIGEIEPNNILRLDDNYRTNEGILNFINYLFEKLMEDDYIDLKPNKSSELDFEVEVINSGNFEYNQDEEKSYQNRKYEGQMIASRINSLIVNSRFDYGDIAILFRASTRTDIYEEALKDYGIPYYNLTNFNFMNTEEIKDIKNAIKAFLNLDDFISNIGFLRSPMVGFSDDDILLLMREEGNLLEKLQGLKEKKSPDLDQKLLERSLKLYKLILEKKERLNSFQFLNLILEETKYKDLVLLLENGRQKYANIEKFQSLILDYEKDYLEDYYHILAYMDELEDRKLSEASIVSEDANVVKIMTIHKSKGLEFPVVILPELSIKDQPIRDKILFHKDMGLGIDAAGGNIFFQDIKTRITRENKAEEKRVLYVAMTRAEKLLIIGNQGEEFGDKSGVTSYLTNDKCRYISDLETSLESRKLQSYIEEDLDFSGSFKPKNLIEMEDYNLFDMNRFSISDYLKFKDCQRMFYLDKFHKLSSKLEFLGFDQDLTMNQDMEIKEEELSALEKGNIIHRFCELYRPAEDLDRLLGSISLEFGYDYKDIKEELSFYVDNFIKNTDENFEKIYREQEFVISLEEGNLSGVIDRINYGQDGLEIIDYKTNKVKSKKYLEKLYEDQILCYIYVGEKILGEKVKRGRILLLQTGEFIDVDFNKEKIDDVIGRINAFIKFVKDNRKMENYSRNDDCNAKCRYFNFCNRKTP